MKRYNPEKHNRRSIRLKGRDYSQPGAYFVTICTQDHECLFGDIVNARMQLNAVGGIVEDCWTAIPDHFPHAIIDEYVVMPDHMHGIVTIAVGVRHAAPRTQRHTERFGKPVPGSIPTIIRSFKSVVTKRVNEFRGTPGASVWQRGYYESIVCDSPSLDCIRNYIRNNPSAW